MTIATPRLQALRRSHCDTCGCRRCRWIDARIADAESQVHMPDSDSFWIIEGALKIDEKGELGLEHDGNMISLTEALAGRSGHHVLVLVGALQEQTLID